MKATNIPKESGLRGNAPSRIAEVQKDRRYTGRTRAVFTMNEYGDEPVEARIWETKKVRDFFQILVTSRRVRRTTAQTMDVVEWLQRVGEIHESLRGALVVHDNDIVSIAPIRAGVEPFPSLRRDHVEPRPAPAPAPKRGGRKDAEEGDQTGD